MKARSRPCLLAFALLCFSVSRAADSSLEQGNAAFHDGRFEEAARLYESEEEGADLLTRRFNAGVSWARAGAPDKALERFEDVSARADGELRASAFYNAGHAAFDKASAIAAQADGMQDPDEKVKKLAEAATAFRSAAHFFRSVEPPDAATGRNIAVTKTALRSLLDQIAQIEAEKKKKAEEDAMKSPAELLRAIAEKERTHRGLARALMKEEAQKIRLGSRRLRKSEAENRTLLEKLERHLKEPPPAPPAPPGAQAQPQPPPAPEPPEDEKARNARGLEAIGRAIEAQKDSELAYGKLDPATASASHTKAVGELRSAIETFPLDIATLIGESLSRQETLNGTADSLAKASAGGLATETKGDGMGKKLVDAIKDKVLLPLAKLIAPGSSDDAKSLADDEDDVVWGANIISQAEIKPSGDPHGAPAQPGAPEGAPHLTEEQAKELSEGLRREGKTAHEASVKAKESLAAGNAAAALPPAKEALEALKRAADLLPKPPRPPEERLKELIEKQKGARQATEALPGLADDARAAASKELEGTQRVDGKEATGIADELEQKGAGQGAAAAAQPADAIREAVKKVREGGEKIFSSAELLGQKKVEDAKTAIDRDVALLEEALALLQGKKQDDKQDEQKQEQKKQEQEKKQDSKQEKKSKGNEKPYALSPRDARFKQQEMDRKRREEEAKLFSGPSRMTVERDW